MALHLNLYHEIHKQQALQRRDPLKFAIAGLILVAAGFAGYYLLQLNNLRTLRNDLARLRAEGVTLTPKIEAAKKREAEASATMKVGEVLVKRMEERFYWAPVLEKIAKVVPPEVQIRRLSGDVNGEAVKRCSLTLDGLAGGDDPRKVAEELRRMLIEEFSTTYKSVAATFRPGGLEESPEIVTLKDRKLATATFSINLTMQFGEEETAQTARRPAKK